MQPYANLLKSRAFVMPWQYRKPPPSRSLDLVLQFARQLFTNDREIRDTQPDEETILKLPKYS
jgi:hypothetical protein